MRLLAHAVIGLSAMAAIGFWSGARASEPPAVAGQLDTAAIPPQAGASQAAADTPPKPLRQLVPPTRPKNIDNKVERRRPSGFWTSTRPAKGGAYRYRLLGIGVVLLILTLAGMIWLVRRHTRSEMPAPVD